MLGQKCGAYNRAVFIRGDTVSEISKMTSPNAFGYASKSQKLIRCETNLFSCEWEMNVKLTEIIFHTGASAPPKKAACEFSQFGCCWDKVTKALGPNNAGCKRKSELSNSILILGAVQ